MSAESPQTKPSVLIVDDTGTNLVVLSAVLSPLRVRLVEANSGKQALERVREESFAVVLLDVQMPEMDGFEVARRIRQLELGRELPIIFVTAIHLDEAFVRRGYAAGAADYITKPFDVDVLRARVKAFVDLYQQREEVRRAQVALRTRERDEALRRVVAFERVATAALETNDLGALLEELLGIFLDGSESADFARILLRGGEDLHVAASASRGDPMQPERTSSRREETFTGFIAVGRHALEVRGDQRALPLHAGWLEGQKAHALYGVPLLNDNELLGVAYMGSRDTARLTERERKLFGAVAERIAWAIAKHTARVRLQSILTSAPVMIATFSGSDQVADFVNPSLESFLGRSDCHGKTAREIGLDETITALLNGVFLSGEELTYDELPVKAAFDRRRNSAFVNVTALPVKSPLGSTDGVTMFAVDVTAQVNARQQAVMLQEERTNLLERERAARAEAEAANRAKDEFLATLSHELRTPLNAVLGWSQRARTKTGAELERALTIIGRNAQAQARIVDDMLDLSRIVNGKLSLELLPVRAGEPLRGALESLRPTADAKEVALDVRFESDPEVNADADRLQQIVWNLLSNAIKFTPAGGRVGVVLRTIDEAVVIDVSDTGQGIAPEFLPNVFAPFRQADGSATRRHGGLGLGLAIAKQLAEAHAGKLSARSEGVGTGSVFTLELPLRDANAPFKEQSRRMAGLPGGASARFSDAPRLDQIKVLIVDDEADARNLVAEVLVDTGAIVRTAECAADALTELHSFRPHVLVSDIAMPGADGYQLMRQVRALPVQEGGATKAVALTAFARTEDVERALAAGFEHHLSKPVDLEKLKAVVASLAAKA